MLTPVKINNSQVYAENIVNLDLLRLRELLYKSQLQVKFNFLKKNYILSYFSVIHSVTSMWCSLRASNPDTSNESDYPF